MSHDVELIRIHDRTIPTRRERMGREDEPKIQEVIRRALQSSATEAAREEVDVR
jgi:hypothetical protein